MSMPTPKTLAVAALACLASFMATASFAATPGGITETAASRPAPGEAVAQLAAWVRATGDNGGRPFAIIDKLTAEVFVFGSEGDLRGATPALLGLAAGDNSTAGIGDRELSKIPPEQRTTPAGRFVSSFGRASGGQTVLWVDYATAVSLHPVVTANVQERRLQRLQTPTPEDNRITYGCINVSAGFFEDVVRRTFEGTSGIFYVLPDTKRLDEVFPTFARQALALVPDVDSRADVLANAAASPASETVAVR